MSGTPSRIGANDGAALDFRSAASSAATSSPSSSALPFATARRAARTPRRRSGAAGIARHDQNGPAQHGWAPTPTERRFRQARRDEKRPRPLRDGVKALRDLRYVGLRMNARLVCGCLAAVLSGCPRSRPPAVDAGTARAVAERIPAIAEIPPPGPSADGREVDVPLRWIYLLEEPAPTGSTPYAVVGATVPCGFVPKFTVSDRSDGEVRLRMRAQRRDPDGAVCAGGTPVVELVSIGPLIPMGRCPPARIPVDAGAASVSLSTRSVVAVEDHADQRLLRRGPRVEAVAGVAHEAVAVGEP